MQALTSTRAYNDLGCLPTTTTPGTYRFAVWAPNAKAVSLVGDFNGWDGVATPMSWTEGGVWRAEVSGLTEGMAYKYAVQARSGETVLKADPFARHAETGPATASKVWSIEGYRWGDGAWLKRRAGWDVLKSPMSVYELHLGSWKVAEGAVYPSYRQLAEELCAYIKDMGFTHVELMPLTEYPYEGSWGYQATGYFAPTSRYGTPQDFMYLVDTLHQNGILCIIVTVGPKQVAEVVSDIWDFDGSYGSDYQVTGGVFTGEINAYVRAEDKLGCLQNFCEKHDIEPKDCVAVGDGATDIPLFEYCGKSIAINYSSAVIGKATHYIKTQDLSDILRYIID